MKITCMFYVIYKIYAWSKTKTIKIWYMTWYHNAGKNNGMIQAEKNKIRVKFRAHFHWPNKFAGTKFSSFSKQYLSISNYNYLDLFLGRALGIIASLRCILVMFRLFFLCVAVPYY